MTSDMPARMLRLLSLMQTRRAWPGQELADRLNVTLRTVRRDIDRLRELDYTRRQGAPGSRRVEPHSLVPAMGHWYLVAYDTRAEDWRICRLDRTAGPAPTGHRVPARTLPAPDPAAFVAAKVATAPARHRAVATVHAPAVAVLARTQGLPGRVTPIDDATCTVDLSGGSLARIAQLVAALDADYTPDADPEVVGYLRAAAQRTLHRTQPVGDSWPEPR